MRLQLTIIDYLTKKEKNLLSQLYKIVFRAGASGEELLFKYQFFRQYVFPNGLS